MMSALNSIYSAQSDGSHFKDYMQPFWEVALNKKFDLTQSKIVSLRYRVGFDPGGNTLTFPENRTGLHCHDIGSSILSDMTEIMVYIDGRLIAPSDRYVLIAQGGFSVYVKESVVTLNASVAQIVVLRKFNQLGISRNAYTSVKNTGSTTTSPFDIVVNTLSSLGNVFDIRYYKLFHKLPTDRYFRPVDESLWGSRVSATSDAAVFTKTDGALANEEFVVVCTADFWKYEFDGTLTENSNTSLVDLVDQYGLPAPIWSIEDIDVYVNGRLMRPNIDYCIQWGSPSSKRHPPRVILWGIPTGRCHILVMTNAPHDDILSPTIREDALSDPYAIYRLPPLQRPIRLIEDVGMVFSNGYLRNVGDEINVIADNYGLHLGNLPDTNYVYYRARFVMTSLNIEGALREGGYQTALEKFVTLVGLRPDGSPADGSSPLGGFDFIESYKYNSGCSVVPSNPIIWANTFFNALYFWVRDEQQDARNAGEPLDVRETDSSNLAVYDPWNQEGVDLVFDCRSPITTDSGYTTSRELNCRNV
jgi:hypothetical protein